MPTFTMTAYPATFDGIWVSVSFFLCEGPKHVIPPEKIEAKTTVDALHALIGFHAKAKATGKPCRCTIDLDRGQRAPNGWRKVHTSIDYNPATDGAPEAQAAQIAAE